MIQIIRYIKGYLAIRVFGFSPERFMNLCSHHNIFLWDVENHGDYYAMKISLKGFYRLRGITRKTGTRVVITRRYGLPFLSTRLWRRRIFLLGLLGSLAFWVWMSRFIWAVEVEGNYFVTTDVFEDFLLHNGIEVGMKKDSVEIEKLEKAIRTQFDIVTWTSAQIDGTRLLIRVKENDLIMTENKEMGALPGEGMDLVAGKEGEIVSIVTRSGVPKVTAGATVAKGDVLVEGGVPILNEDGTVSYPEGVDGDSAPYAGVSEPFLWPNYTIMYPVDWQGADYVEKVDEDNANAKPSAATGFIWDTTEFRIRLRPATM